MLGRILLAEEFKSRFLNTGEELFTGRTPEEIQAELDQAHIIVCLDLNVDPAALPNSDIYKMLIATYSKHRICTHGLVKKDSVSAYLKEYERMVTGLKVKSFAVAYMDYEGPV